MFRSKFLAILLLSSIVTGCAPQYIKHRVTYITRQKVVRESYTKLKECESNNNSAKIKNFLNNIRYYLGTPYHYGGDTKQAMDCSGFVSAVFQESFGIKLPHNADQIYQSCQKLSATELKMGDLVFFQIANDIKINHVGIYLAKNYFAHSSVSYGIIVSELTEKYYRSRYVGAGRIIDIKALSVDDR